MNKSQSNSFQRPTEGTQRHSSKPTERHIWSHREPMRDVLHLHPHFPSHSVKWNVLVKVMPTALTNKLKIVQCHKHNRSFLPIMYTELANRKAETRVARSSVRMYILLKERRERGCRRVHGGLSGPGLEVVHIPSPKFP